MILEKLRSLEQESIQRGIPILGSEKGAWLYKKVVELEPKRVLELGTANGYSGIILGSTGAELLTIEMDMKIAEEAQKNFSRFGIVATVLVGDAVEQAKILAQDSNNYNYFDIVFIDFAKKQYISVLQECLTMVKKGGYIIADNITMEGCQDFRARVLSHPRLQTELISIKDGLSCSKKSF